MSHTPVYRTYLLQCSANPGKVEAIAAWVAQWRELATLERDYQIAHFRNTVGKQGLHNKVEQGCTRPWFQDGRCSVTMAQQIMSQVCAQLKGHLETLKNAVQALIGEQARDPDNAWDAKERHRPYSVNRHGLYEETCVSQLRCLSPATGPTQCPVVILAQTGGGELASKEAPFCHTPGSRFKGVVPRVPRPDLGLSDCAGFNSR